MLENQVLLFPTSFSLKRLLRDPLWRREEEVNDEEARAKTREKKEKKHSGVPKQEKKRKKANRSAKRDS